MRSVSGNREESEEEEGPKLVHSEDQSEDQCEDIVRTRVRPYRDESKALGST